LVSLRKIPSVVDLLFRKKFREVCKRKRKRIDYNFIDIQLNQMLFPVFFPSEENGALSGSPPLSRKLEENTNKKHPFLFSSDCTSKLDTNDGNSRALLADGKL